MINSHIHLIPEDTDRYASVLASRMEEHGIRASVLFGSACEQSAKDEETRRICESFGDTFIPFLASNVDIFHADAIDKCLSELESGFWKGVGEIFLDCTDDLYVQWVDKDGNEQSVIKPVPEDKERCPLYKSLFEYCGKHGLPVLVHCMDADVMSRALGAHRETTFIWAHCDHEFWPDVPARLLHEHRNLVCEIGATFRFQSTEIVSGRMEPWQRDKIAAWQRNCEQFPNRIVWGSDVYTWDDLSPEKYAQDMQAWEFVASGLDPKTRDLVTGGNIARLLNLVDKSV